MDGPSVRRSVMVEEHSVRWSMMENVTNVAYLLSKMFEEVCAPLYLMTMEAQVHDGPNAQLAALESASKALRPHMGGGKALRSQMG